MNQWIVLKHVMRRWGKEFLMPVACSAFDIFVLQTKSSHLLHPRGIRPWKASVGCAKVPAVGLPLGVATSQQQKCDGGARAAFRLTWPHWSYLSNSLHHCLATHGCFQADTSAVKAMSIRDEAITRDSWLGVLSLVSTLALMGKISRPL